MNRIFMLTLMILCNIIKTMKGVKVMKHYRNRARPNKEEFERLYYTLGLPVTIIAQMYNVTINTVYNWAYYFRLNDKEVKQ